MGRSRELAELASAYDGSSLGFRNRIINGDMRIDQRNAGAAVTNTTSSIFTVDRFGVYGTQASKLTMQQNAGAVTPPNGFKNYLGLTSTSAYAVPSTDWFVLYQSIEGYNTADLAWGTASAQAATLSFWVRSSLTGTFVVQLRGAGYTRSYPATYTINSANTWEYKTITIPGDTTGSYDTTNGNGIQVAFNLGMGSSFNTTSNTWGANSVGSVAGAVSVVGTNGATFYITGVQLEAGTVATPFERRPYGLELTLCQRYCYAFGDGYRYIGDFTNNVGGNAINAYWFTFPAVMRASPTFSLNGASIAGSFGSGAQYMTPSGFTYTILRSGFAWETAGLLQTGNFLFTAEL